MPIAVAEVGIGFPIPKDDAKMHCPISEILRVERELTKIRWFLPDIWRRVATVSTITPPFPEGVTFHNEHTCRNKIN